MDKNTNTILQFKIFNSLAAEDRILLLLFLSKESLTMKEIMRDLQITKLTTINAIKRLEEKKLINRSLKDTPSRAIRIFRLSELGIEYVTKNIRKPLQILLHQDFSRLQEKPVLPDKTFKESASTDVINIIFDSPDPEFAEPLNVTGLMRYRLKNYKRAFEFFSKAARIDPNSRVSNFGMAMCVDNDPELKKKYGHKIRDSLFVDAQKTKEESVPFLLTGNQEEKLPIIAHYMINIEKILKEKSLDIAIDYLRRSLNRDSGDQLIDKTILNSSERAVIYNAMGHLLLDKAYANLLDDKILEEAKETYKRVIKMMEDEKQDDALLNSGASAWRALGEIDFHLNQIEKALKECDQAINLSKKYFYGHITKGIILWKTNSRARALHCFTEALELKKSRVKFDLEKINSVSKITNIEKMPASRNAIRDEFRPGTEATEPELDRMLNEPFNSISER
ncbi:MAG: hypothetical protein KGI07_04730 [Thaumarchaeota archaeon]|nr:hypothetical protein [Nitrososphaerota archaeon]